MKTPYEIMNDKKPTLKYFHVFGAKCFVLKDREMIVVASSRLKHMKQSLLATPRRSYMVYIIGQHQVKESVNVTFDDTKLPSIQTKDASDEIEV